MDERRDADGSDLMSPGTENPLASLAGYLTGPTATGKSEVGLILAERYGWSLLSVDSRQIYRGLEIGTAKPSPEERARVDHLLLDLLEPEEPCSAGTYRALALQALRDEAARGRTALAVGGAGLYWEALTVGLHALPRADAILRARHDAILEEEGPEGLYRRLLEVDPESAARLAPRDRQRVSRALEIHELTGKPMSALLREARDRRAPFGHEAPSPPVIALQRPREELRDRIEGRCAAMLEAGLLEEIQDLLDQGIPPDAPGFQTVGYREFLPHLLQGVPLDSCVSRFLHATRHYAKRQETWLRHRTKDVLYIRIAPGERPDETACRVARALGKTP